MAAENTNTRGPIGNIIAIVVIVAIVAVGLWGATTLIRVGPSWFSSLSFSNLFGGNNLQLASEQLNVQPEVPFTLSWEDQAREGGVYAFAYQCVDGVQISASSALGVYSQVACDTPYEIASEARSLSLVARAPANRTIDVPFALAYITSGEKETEASGMMRIAGNGTSSTTTPTTTPPVTSRPPTSTTATTTQPRPTTPVAPKPQIVNLAIQSVQLGSGATGVWTTKNTFASTEIAMVRVRVTNTGTVTSGTWRFVATLPTNPMQQYVSNFQRGLRPSESMDVSVGFDHLQTGTGIVTVRLETQGADANPSDNTTVQTITVY